MKGQKGGRSAGTAVVTPCDVLVAVKEGAKVDASPPASKGRLAHAWIQQGPPCGIMVASLYLRHTDGPTERKSHLLNRALWVTVEAGCPWVIGLDANDTPEGFGTWAKMPIGRAGRRLVHQVEATHFPGEGEARNLDFFIVSESLGGMGIGVNKVEDVPTAPH